MTAESPFVSPRLFRGLRKLSFQPLRLEGENRNLSVKIFSRDLAKRSFDIVFSLAVLILFAPVYLLLALLIAIISPGPIFYLQTRIGKNHRPFKCIKFRTMVTNADEVLQDMLARHPELRQEYADNFKLKNDPRITWIGKFLRVTSLDEFPQFLNVLKGEMSVVGPRPLVPDELFMYGRYIDKVLTIKPGITGIWQVSGRNDIPYDKRVKIDVYYVNNRNLLLDLSVIFKTIGVVLFPTNNGAY
ncbi:sugar transferase [Aerosakkonemataceae cyanobacterium BLCC-F50]|uniref:Sugar transferase n=1 Tax=Floridaenema flaviceps BLCC-F50 TaxID=3153642 RepID=A0ABV4XLM3_9CYAN